MHAQLRISTTANDTKSTKLARPVEADSEILAHSWLPAGFLWSWLVRRLLLRWCPTRVLGFRVIEMQESIRGTTGQMNWLVVTGLITQMWVGPWILAHSRGSNDLNLTLQSKFSVLSIVCCRFQGWQILMHSFYDVLVTHQLLMPFF